MVFGGTIRDPSWAKKEQQVSTWKASLGQPATFTGSQHLGQSPIWGPTQGPGWGKHPGLDAALHVLHAPPWAAAS